MEKIKCDPWPRIRSFYCNHEWASEDLITDEERSHCCSMPNDHDWVHECSCGSVKVGDD